MLLPIYECPECGETWRISIEEGNDTEPEDATKIVVCMNCGNRIFKQKYDEKGIPVCHLITDEELEAENKPYVNLNDIDADDLCLEPNGYYNE